ncbi:hypothetical protein LguiA_002786 [Lonicera macranthoides]
MDVCWDPYKEHRATRPFLEISYFCGLLVCFDVVELYYSDCILRQFEKVQTIPMMLIVKPLKSTKGKKTQSFNVVYVNRHQQKNRSNHILNPIQRSIPVTYSWECKSNYMEWFLKVTQPYIQVPTLRKTPRKAREEQCIANDKLQVEVKKVISMLYEAFNGDEAEDISIVARNAYDILLNAMKATAPEKAQEHDPNATPSGTTKPLPKHKGNTYMTRRRKN